MTNTVTSGWVERCKPYRVLMTCGHEEIRMMREATAGVPWSEDVVLTAKAGCAKCDPSKARQSYFASYYSTDPDRMLLGGVLHASQSSRFSHEADAEARLDAVIEIHKGLTPPLRVEGRVFESTRKAEIVRHCNTPQAVGCRCPECGATV